MFDFNTLVDPEKNKKKRGRNLQWRVALRIKGGSIGGFTKVTFNIEVDFIH